MTAVVLFTRDLRVRDQPALATAVREHEHVIPLFVFDERLSRSANRLAFLLDAVADLRSNLGGALVVRRGDPVTAISDLTPSCVYVTADWSLYARERERRLREVVPVRVLPGASVVEPGVIAPSASDHYRVFTPYWRAWRAAPRREVIPLVHTVLLPTSVDMGDLPTLRDLTGRAPSPELPRGGETAGRQRLERFLASGLSRYSSERDALARDATSRLSPYLRFGCISPLEVAELLGTNADQEELLRQLCWRDFCLQLLAAFPRLPVDDFRPRAVEWRTDEDALEAWREGRTGIPVVDAGLRQLAREGWMPNRARMLAASLLTKDLGIDWRLGAEHFLELLVDGDPASNSANWQWVAGTGTDPRPNRTFNPVRQARRFDPDGSYVRRHVHELAALEAPRIHEPWLLGADTLARLGYPPPLVDPSRGRRRIVPT